VRYTQIRQKQTLLEHISAQFVEKPVKGSLFISPPVYLAIYLFITYHTYFRFGVWLKNNLRVLE